MVMYKGKKYAAAFVANIIKGSPASKAVQAEHLTKKCRKPSSTRRSKSPSSLPSLCKKRKSRRSKSKSRSRSRSGSKGSKGKKHRRSSRSRSASKRRSTRRRTATKKFGF
jgi:hypothetical protein